MTVAPTCGKLEKIGFFHFVDEYPNPISALAKAIGKEQENHTNISNSLIVLPEAFNCGSYRSHAELLPAQEILENLRCKLAGPLRITFVVGVLEPCRTWLGHDGKRNSAYWVDANGTQLMCHKMGDDGKKLYDPCARNPDPRNPIACANARVCALICMDATDETTDNSGLHIQQHRKQLLADLNAGEGHKIVCVPARFNSTWPDPSKLLSVLPDYWYVAADGQHNGHSLISHERSGGSSRTPIKPAPGEGNTVKLWPLS
jgi:predicted amidohydrolase